MNPISFRLNGCTTTLNADGDTPLVYILRNDLGLKGTRFVAGADVETVESLTSAGGNNPLLASFAKEQS
jgi:aerobic-type carbon monoxide dehydrogenase small subunit (CoxS/CutS family)